MNNKVTACIVLYKNDREVLKEAISSYLKIELSTKLYLIDNSPTDDLKNICLDERVEYVSNPSNPGFGAAHNIALKKTIAEGTTYHLVLNPDVYFEPNIIEEIISYMDANPDIGNLMPKVEYPDGSIQYLCKLLPTPYDWIGRRFNPIRSMVSKRNELFELRFTRYNKIMEIPYLSGCFMFLRVSALQNVGFFDDGIFMYGEEADLCRRLIQSGYKAVFYPKVKITHHFEKGSHKSFKLTLVGIKSAIYYFNKWGWFLDRQRREINKRTLEKLNNKQNS